MPSACYVHISSSVQSLPYCTAKPWGMCCFCQFGALPLLILLALHPYWACENVCSPCGTISASCKRGLRSPSVCSSSAASMACAPEHQLLLPCCYIVYMKGKQAIQNAEPAVLLVSFGIYLLKGDLGAGAPRAQSSTLNKQRRLDRSI